MSWQPGMPTSGNGNPNYPPQQPQQGGPYYPQPGQQYPQPGQQYPPQGQYYPPQGYATQQPPAPPKKKINIWLIILVGILAIFAAIGIWIWTGITPKSFKDKVYAPSGDSINWLHAGYAAGAPTAVKVDWKVFGFSQDGKTALGGRMSSTVATITAGLDTKTGAVKYTLEGTHCFWEHQVKNGLALCGTEAGELVIVDIATGTTKAIYRGESVPKNPEVIAIDATSSIFHFDTDDGTAFVSLPGDGSVKWQTLAQIKGYDCTQIDERIGCQSSSSFIVLDSDSGNELVAESPYLAVEDQVSWATDGFIVGPDYYFEGEQGRVFDYNGKQTGSVKRVSEPAFPNSKTDGAVYSLNALRQGGNIFLVDGAGSVVVENAESRLEGGEIRIQPGDVDAPMVASSPTTVTEDGSAIWFTDFTNAHIYDRQGNRAYEIAGGGDATIISGIAVVQDGLLGMESTIYVPQGL